MNNTKKTKKKHKKNSKRLAVTKNTKNHNHNGTLLRTGLGEKKTKTTHDETCPRKKLAGKNRQKNNKNTRRDVS